MKTVLVITATGIVSNVIRLTTGTPFNPPPGQSMVSVADTTVVSPGQRYIANSEPPAFEDVPEEEQPQVPVTEDAAIEALEAVAQGMLQALADLRSVRGG